MVIRIYPIGPQAFYEYLWACNMGFFISGYGLMYDKPLLVGMVIVNLSFD